jgi:uncharacterized protein YcbX
MDDLYLQDIYIYPIKSLGGISLQQAEVQHTGLQYDRRWMLTDKAGNFLSQRSVAQMALLQVNIAQDGLVVNLKKKKLEVLTIPFNPATGREVTVTVWDDVCTALEVSAWANKWFSDALEREVRLVFMPATTNRWVDNTYASNNEIVSFADDFPLLMIGQSSLDELNSRLDFPVPMNRFRPNLVFKGGTPFCEDLFKEFMIGEVTFNVAKPCGRCVITTINQDDGSKGQEPLRTLATYRIINHKIMFGQNLLHRNTGTIKTGEKIKIISSSK